MILLVARECDRAHHTVTGELLKTINNSVGYTIARDYMIRVSGIVLSAVLAATAFVAAVTPAVAQVQKIKPVTDEMLRDPSPNDWLMYSRTYNAFRDSPLKQINQSNVKNLRMAWVRGLEDGVTETIPIVHDGAMYVIAPGGIVDALDAEVAGLALLADAPERVERRAGRSGALRLVLEARRRCGYSGDAFRAPSAAGSSERGDVRHRNHRHGWGNEHLLARRRFQLRHQRFGRQVAIGPRG